MLSALSSLGVIVARTMDLFDVFNDSLSFSFSLISLCRSAILSSAAGVAEEKPEAGAAHLETGRVDMERVPLVTQPR